MAQPREVLGEEVSQGSVPITSKGQSCSISTLQILPHVTRNGSGCTTSKPFRHVRSARRVGYTRSKHFPLSLIPYPDPVRACKNDNRVLATLPHLENTPF